MKKIIGLISSIGLLLSQTAAAQDKGYVQDEVIKVAGITTDNLIYGLSLTQKQTSKVYMDGFGRQQQAIGVQASPLQKDMIQPVVYDNAGRQSKEYLPYTGSTTDGSFHSSFGSEQQAFYNNSSQTIIPIDLSPFATQLFENSPMQRLINAGMVGAGFQVSVAGNHVKTVGYRYNTSADGNILIWNPDGTFTASNYFAAGSLAITDATDEDGIETQSFTDMAGRQILKRQIISTTLNQDTYYIYNNAGMVIYIIPPLAVAAANYNLNTAPMNTMIFKFVYDSRGRLVEKTVPAKGLMSIVYDPLNRPVLMQDANMLALNQWNYIKYDAEGRAVSQGIYVDATRTGRTAMQNYVNTLATTYSTAWYESRTATLTAGGYYTSTIFPTTATGTLTPLAFAYFDDYDLKQDGSVVFATVTSGLSPEPVVTTAPVKGVPTIVSKTTVGVGLSNTWLTAVTFFDKRGNAIQTRSNNQLYYINATTLTDAKTSQPDFMGVPAAAKVSKQTAASTTVTVQTNLTYDHMYRVTAVSQQYNGGAAIKVAAYTYNELGQVMQKGLGYVNSTTWLQTVDLRYNIRGQLLTLNGSKLTGNDVFGMELLYDKTDANLPTTPKYDGMVSAVKWMSKDGTGANSMERAYRYSYDNAGRDTSAIYAERPAAATSTTPFTVTHGWDENRISYYVNGNIAKMFRMSTTQGSGSHTPIDNLTYTYDTNNPNRLRSVSDATGNVQGFIPGTGNYSYDSNGNLTADPYKGITNISYNVLNRTDKISFTASANRYINYTYDGGGQLIRKQQYDNVSGSAQLITTTDYIDGFVYITSGTGTPALSYFPMPEGRVLYNAGAFNQEFVISDQQGNARVSFQNNGSGMPVVKQENSYYPFGMIMPNSPVATPATPNKKLYNGGSEWQNDYSNLPDYYQTFNRNYDAAIGMFIGVDPSAESAESMTTYQYAGNNPVMNNDPAGDFTRQNAPPKPIPYNYVMGEGFVINNYIGSFGTLTTGGIPDDLHAAGPANSDATDYWNNVNYLLGTDYGGTINSTGAHPFNQNTENDYIRNKIFGGISPSYYAGIEPSDDVAGTIRLAEVKINSWGNLASAIQNEAYQTEFYNGVDQGGSLQDIRNKIVSVAENYEGSTAWAYNKSKGNFPAGCNKCNLYVNDVLRKAGASPGLPHNHGTNPYTAADWANPFLNIPGWKVLTGNQPKMPGDVVAVQENYSDATGHVGIVIGPNLTSSFSSITQSVTENNWGFRSDNGGWPVFRRYVGP